MCARQCASRSRRGRRAKWPGVWWARLLSTFENNALRVFPAIAVAVMSVLHQAERAARAAHQARPSADDAPAPRGRLRVKSRKAVRIFKQPACREYAYRAWRKSCALA